MDKEFARFIQSRCKFIKIKCKNRAQISIENNSSLSLKAISIERENDFSILLLFSISQVFHEFYVFVTNSTASVKRIVTLSCYCSPTTFLLQRKPYTKNVLCSFSLFLFFAYFQNDKEKPILLQNLVKVSFTK